MPSPSPSPSLPALHVSASLVEGKIQPTPVPELDTAALQLRVVNHRYVHAVIDPSGQLIEAMTHPDFLFTHDDGNWSRRTESFVDLRRKRPPDAAAIEDMRVRLVGSVALVHGVFTSTMPGSSATRVRYTDVHAWSGSAWRLVSVQETVLAEGVSTPLIVGVATAQAPWRGDDPVGDDATVLHALNENYVKAFREADVAWYDAHLTPDYVVVSGDGRLQDRAAALAHFALPTFATNMRSFPVGRVAVRRFADVALIHAENAYELKDGRHGVSRYTDIWNRQDGRWLCVAAHITEHRSPA